MTPPCLSGLKTTPPHKCGQSVARRTKCSGGPFTMSGHPVLELLVVAQRLCDPWCLVVVSGGELEDEILVVTSLPVSLTSANQISRRGPGRGSGSFRPIRRRSRCAWLRSARCAPCRYGGGSPDSGVGVAKPDLLPEPFRETGECDDVCAGGVEVCRRRQPTLTCDFETPSRYVPGVVNANWSGKSPRTATAMILSNDLMPMSIARR